MKRFLRWLFRKILGEPHFLVLVGAVVLFGARADAQGCFGPGCGGTSSGVTPATLNDATYCPDVGASDAYVCSMVSAPSSYAAGMLVTLSANTANTGTASVNVNSLGVKTITRADGSTLVTGDIAAAMPVLLEYDGTNFRVLSTPASLSPISYNGSVLTLGGSISAGTSGSVSVSGGHLLVQPTYGLFFGSAGTSPFIGVRTGLTPNAPGFFTYSTSNSWHFAESADNAYDFQNPCLTGLGTAACTDPTLILHSATQATNQAMSLGHNQTQGVITANGGVLARSLTYASGSDVGLTVQCSLTGNCYDIKNSANTTLFSLSTGMNMVWSSSVSSPSLQADAVSAIFTLRAGGATNNNTLVLDANSGDTTLSGYQQKNKYIQKWTASSTSAINSGHIFDTSPGNTSSGFGTGLLIRGQSSTTASQDMVRLSGVWTDATHATRTSAATIETVTSAGALAEVARFNAAAGMSTLTSTGGLTTRSATYASGSDVALTVQGSLTGNIQNWLNSAGTKVVEIANGGYFGLGNPGTLSSTFPVRIKVGTNQQIYMGSNSSKAFIGGVNDAASANVPLDLRANPVGIYGGSSLTSLEVTFAGDSNTNPVVTFDNLAAAKSIIVAKDNGTQKWSIGDGGQPVYATTVPAVSNTSANSCGTTAASIAGTNETGIITVGATSGTSCTLTFALAAPTRRQCIATNETSGLAVQSTYSSTTVSILAGTFAASDVIAYVCQVY